MLHRFFTGLHRRCSLFVHDLHSLFITRKFSVISGCVLIAIMILAGCGRPAAPSSESDSKAADASTNTLQAASEPLLKFHWIGKKRLATEANATNFMAIWNLPESARLEAQTLDKLATAPWRLWQTNVALSNAPSNLLRTLLDDLVQEEVYVEATGGSNQISELVIALRLPDDRAALWETNLPIVLNSLSKLNLALDRSSQSAAAAPNWQLSLTRTGHWTFVSVARPVTDSLLVQTFASHIAANGAPYAPRATNYIIEAEAQLAAFKNFLSPLPPQQSVSLRVFGDGGNLRTRGSLDFIAPLNLALEPWQVPTNLIGGPLIGFSALRGLGDLVQTQSFWTERNLGDAPNQVFFWSQRSAPWLHFFAARSPMAQPQFLVLKDFILDTVNPALVTNRTGNFVWLTNESRVVWKGVPFCNPTFTLTNDFITGGFVALPPVKDPIPQEFVLQIHRDPDLLFYDWEETGAQVGNWNQIFQLLRLAFGRAQLSITNGALPWLNTAGTNLSYTATSVSVQSNKSFAFARASTVGFNSIELQILADWIDSPQFPLGLHTFTAPRQFISDRRPPGR